MDFVAAAANLRARSYGIQEVDRSKVKQIAGRIIPAIATTTSAVSGLVCIELMKIARRSPLAEYHCSSVTLALPSVQFFEPVAAPKTSMTSRFSFCHSGLSDRSQLTTANITDILCGTTFTFKKVTSLCRHFSNSWLNDTVFVCSTFSNLAGV